MTKSYRRDPLAAIHETMEALNAIGSIDKQTMHNFDDACLTAVQPFTPDEIRALREREQLSQPVFARYLNVSKNLISEWERGTKKPGGPASLAINSDRPQGHTGHFLMGGVGKWRRGFHYSHLETDPD